VPGDRRPADAESRSELIHRRASPSQSIENRSPGGV
jgi:hypothetical protein